MNHKSRKDYFKLLFPQVSEFEDLLAKNPGQFHFARTARCLQHQWQSLKQYSLLADQSVQPLLRDNPILNFLDAESSINDAELFDSNDMVMNAELASGDRRYKHRGHFTSFFNLD